ncbi:DUF5949 family protein [Streptomyces candidus]|uniref:Uncharacterized protein n=1 Tax=Streptomyces candidus TaxID=67283 RepID=A0A7X0HAE4_9ACTN|nr:DUF5949 family protein [Streptomyces candidus]MBB6433910.1 hypothetical protein [Streptomyces candidus]
MTSSTAVKPEQQRSLLGTLIIIPWANEPATENGAVTPFLLVCSRGDGRDGPEAGTEALRAELAKAGLSTGGAVEDLTRTSRSSISLLVEAGQAVLSLPFLHVQCPVSSAWQQAAQESGQAFLICATRPWPEAVQGKDVGAEQLRAFVSDERTVPSSVRCLLPVRRVRT